jgi:mannosyltransferase OCH1-like enzyme
MIPKIIHQIAPKDENKWHPIWKECQNSWKNNFSEQEYTYMLWNDDDDILNLVCDKFPEYLEIYNSFQYNIIRIDFAKFCILYQYGGIYADMDMFCYKNFYNHLVDDLYIVESWENWGEKAQNSLMASNQNNNFWIKCIRSCIETYILEKESSYYYINDYILNICGPKLISKLINEKVNLLPKENFNPMIKNQFSWSLENYYSQIYFNTLTEFNKLNKINDNVITRHYLTGKWTMEIKTK